MNAGTELRNGGAERREHIRHAARFVVSIETHTRSGRFGIARNASAGGILFNTPSHFDIGEELFITILFPTRSPMRLKARIVRVQMAGVFQPWHCLAAAAFDEPQPELDGVLTGLAWD